MSTPNGYNNPAYCHQYDSSLYDYQYVPEIDPDSPDLQDESNRKIIQTKLVHPNSANHPRDSHHSSDSSEFGGSDESNGSIIVEECNNRRVTLICEKRAERDVRQEEFYNDRNFKGAYYQDISLESENGYEGRSNGKQKDERSLRHQRPLEPPVTPFGGNNENIKLNRNSSLKQPTTSVHGYQRAQRYHRYEEIPYDEDSMPRQPQSSSIHRYAEITVDENGYPSLSQEIKIEQRKDDYRQKENHPPKPICKPRAISPIDYPKSFSPPQTPIRTPRKSTKEFDIGVYRFSPSSPSPIIYCSSPIRSNSFEMSELSPPRMSNEVHRGSDHTFFINSPKRQPPIGASAAVEPRESFQSNERCILPKNLQQVTGKSGKRCHSLPSSPRRRRDFSQVRASPGKSQNKKVTQIFHIKSSQEKYKTRGESTPARKNISNYFVDQPNESVKMTRSPYKPTTAEINPQKTAIITPIFQRKNQGFVSPKRNFEKMSQAFQSTGNICRSAKEANYPGDIDYLSRSPQEKIISPGKIKRNQSVPNFMQTLSGENRMITRNQNGFEQENDRYAKNLDLQYSPKKPSEHVLSIDKSRISLIEQSSSWSTFDTDYHPRCGGCFIFAALVHLLTASATCAISFYLLSKVGRKYYLDFGLLAGFVNFILGLLGFRSYCWRWLPNRNYVSGFIVLAAFSALTCAGLTYLITAKPMAGDPILDVMGGAICAVSVLTIVLALTGLTMSGCCKAPPPDNRVNDI